ncbi:uncharacterized protein LOC128198928 [Bicyclus anynana]|uniref:Uncharacterized protein LOC128198928 n=1 Tax=Bicyclus anynana TaxID=110368 RepID=A0ABM3LUC8_BICAN|nr:uncharacterized protein LOC128198928 [Bicyclus anynana]
MHNLLDYLSIASTTVESVHAFIFSLGVFKTSDTSFNSLAKRTAPQSSSLGIDTCFIGATLVLEVTKATCTFLCSSITRTYITAEYALLEASLKPCNCTHVSPLLVQKIQEAAHYIGNYLRFGPRLFQMLLGNCFLHHVQVAAVF